MTSAIEESIKDEIGDSYSQSRTSHSRNNIRDTSGSKTTKAQQAKEAEDKLNTFLREVERAIDSERSDREERLARDLKKRKISPRTYDRSIKDIEKWVIKEKKELYQRKRKLEENTNDIKKYVQRFKKDQNSVPMLGRVTSPRNDSSMKSYMDDSENSETMQAAMRQAHLLEKDLTGLSPEQKHAMKKREAALNLIEQKEKAIKKALDEKMMKYQGN